MNARECARRLGLSYRHVIRLLEAGEIVGEREGREWVIAEAEVERVAAERQAAHEAVATAMESAEQLVGIIGTQRGLAQRRVVELAREIIAAADEWQRRADAGGQGMAAVEFSEMIIDRATAIGELAALIRGLTLTYQGVVEQVAAEARGIELAQWESASPTQRRDLLVRLSGATGADRRRIETLVADMDDDLVAEKLRGLDELRRRGAGDFNATPATGEQE